MPRGVKQENLVLSTQLIINSVAKSASGVPTLCAECVAKSAVGAEGSETRKSGFINSVDKIIIIINKLCSHSILSK